MDTISNLLRQWRKKSLWSLVPTGNARERQEGHSWQEFRFGEAELHKLLPHRSPFLLCHELRRFAPVGLPDSPVGLLVGQSYLDPQDPVFAGHFPGNPVYPGTLQIEMLGQLALCLGYFQAQQEQGQTFSAPQQAQNLNIRASKVLAAHYLKPLMPGNTVELLACQLGHSDGWFAQMFGQLLLEGEVVMVCAQEVYFAD